MIINLNVTEYMAPADRYSHILEYAARVDIALAEGRINPPLTTRCPECGSDFADLDEAREDTDHIIIATTSDTTAVIVACEGYFVVNPNLVGIDSPGWSDWMDNPSGGTLPQGAVVEMLPDNCPGVPHRGHTNVDLDCPLH